MRILIVAATKPEIAPLLARMYSMPADSTFMDTYTHGAHDVDVLITGVGMVATAASCARAMARHSYDLALNLGVCGSFDQFFDPGTVVHVLSDRLAEMGAEDGERFMTLQELQLPGESEFVNADPPSNPEIDQLPTVTGITVNTVHGSERSIAAIVERCSPQVESMEGAAFMAACLMYEVPFAQIRAVSNLVERRNRDAWKVEEAIVNLNATALRFLDHA